MLKCVLVFAWMPDLLSFSNEIHSLDPLFENLSIDCTALYGEWSPPCEPDGLNIRHLTPGLTSSYLSIWIGNLSNSFYIIGCQLDPVFLTQSLVLLNADGSIPREIKLVKNIRKSWEILCQCRGRTGLEILPLFSTWIFFIFPTVW